MEKRIFTAVRLAVAAVMILSSTAMVNNNSQNTTEDSIRAIATLNDGPAPIPTCNPRDPHCQMPMMGW